MTNRPVVVLDADVFVPILSCDLLLCAFDHDLYQPVVTPTILSEVGRTQCEDFAHLNRETLTRRAAQVAQTLALHTHADAPVTEAVAGVNTKDRHVAAVAVATKADFVASNDRGLRRQINQLNFRTRAVTVDELMVGLHTSQPDAVRAVIDAMVAKRVPRPISRAELPTARVSSLPRATRSPLRQVEWLCRRSSTSRFRPFGSSAAKPGGGAG